MNHGYKDNLNEDMCNYLCLVRDECHSFWWDSSGSTECKLYTAGGAKLKSTSVTGKEIIG